MVWQLSRQKIALPLQLFNIVNYVLQFNYHVNLSTNVGPASPHIFISLFYDNFPMPAFSTANSFNNLFFF